MEIPLINVADLTKAIESGENVQAQAVTIEGIVDGYLLDVKIKGKTNRLSTYLSAKPRLFKRSDALLKEAQKVGLTSVTFNFD